MSTDHQQQHVKVWCSSMYSNTTYLGGLWGKRKSTFLRPKRQWGAVTEGCPAILLRWTGNTHDTSAAGMGQNQLWLLGASIKCAWLIALLLQGTHLLGPKAKVCFLWFCFLYFFFYIFPPSELGGKGLAVAAVHVCVHTTEKHSA